MAQGNTIRCRMCFGVVKNAHGNKKFCSEKCRKKFWEHYVEPRDLCAECGTLLGIGSKRNPSRYCRTCAGLIRTGGNKYI